MAGIVTQPYFSPTPVLLAFDLPDSKSNPDFLGLVIERESHHEKGGMSDFLFNKDKLSLAKKDRRLRFQLTPWCYQTSHSV